MAKPKVAFYWCSSCGGCEEAIVDLNEGLLQVAEKVDIVFWPCAMDFKYEDVRKMKKKSIDVVFINGAVQNSEHDEMVKLLRQKAKVVVSFGACSNFGGIPGLANFWDRESLMETSYGKTCPSIDNPDFTTPKTKTEVEEGELTLPLLSNTVRSTDQVIDVDYYIPGCAPPPHLTLKALEAILAGELPEKGSVLAPDESLCETCSRKDSKPDTMAIEKVKRVSLVDVDPEECFLAQGIICMGPVTRTGCDVEGEGRCIKVNMPCRGCFGPTAEVKDVGAKMVSAFASIVGMESEENMSKEEVEDVLADFLDPAGTFYRFSLPKSMLRRKMKHDI